jgi:hypothetical protein
VDIASALATAALAQALDLEADRETHLLALRELTYRAQALIERMEAEQRPSLREGSSPSGQDDRLGAAPLPRARSR